MKSLTTCLIAFILTVLSVHSWGTTLPTPLWTWDGSGGSEVGSLGSGEPVYSVNGQVKTIDSMDTKAFTFAFWGKLHTANWQDLAGFATSEGGFKLERRNGTDLFAMYNIGNSGLNCEGLTLSESKYEYYAVVNAGGTFTFYKNGEVIKSGEEVLTATTITWTDAISGENKTAYIGIGCSPTTDGRVDRAVTSELAEVKVYGSALSAEQISAIYTDYTTRAAAMAYLRTVTETAVDWSAPEAWTLNGVKSEAPAEGKPVHLTVNADSTITMNAAATVGALTIDGSAKATFAGDNILMNAFTTVNTDTDVSGITASLGKVTIADGKCLSVGANTEFTRVSASGVLEYKNHVPSPYDLNSSGSTVRFAGTATGDDMLGATNGKIEIGEGAKITVPHLSFLNTYANNSITLDVNGTLTVNTETTDPYGERNDNKGILFGHWLGEGVYNINEGGSLIGEKTYLMTVFTAGSQYINIKGGTLQVRALVANYSNSSITLTDGGTLKLATWTDTGVITQNYGYGTLAAYVSTSDSSTTGWTNPQAVSFTDATNGTTLDPNGLTIAFTGAVTDAVEGGGAKIVVADSSDAKNGVVDFSRTSTLPDTLRYVVNSGVLVLPSGVEGAVSEDGMTTNSFVSVSEGGTLRIVLTTGQVGTGYTALVPDGTNVEFYDGDQKIEAGVNGNVYSCPTPTWKPVNAGSTFDTDECWSNGSVPPEGVNIVIDTSAYDADIAVVVSRNYSSIRVVGNSEHVTSVSFEGSATADAIAFVGLVEFPYDLVMSNAYADGRFTVDDDTGFLVVDSGAEEVTNEVNVAGLWNFAKKGSGTLTLAAQLNGGKKIRVLEGELKFNGQANGYYAANITIDEGATLSVNNTVPNYNPVCGSGIIVNNGILLYNGSPGYTGHLPAEVSGIGKIRVETGNLQLDQVNTYEGGTEIADGATLTVAGLGNLGSSGDVNIAEGATLNIYTTADTQNDHGQEWNRLKGNGTVAYNASGNYYRTFPILAKAFARTLTVENNLAAGLILPETGQAYKIGSLQGTGAFRVDYDQGYPRLLEIFQSKNTTFSGSMLTDNSPDRLSGFYLSGAEGATEKTLTYSGTNTVAKPMMVNASGVLNLTGNWTGAMTVAGTIGGTGTIGGALTFNAGSTLDVSSGAPLTVEGGLILEGKVAVKLPKKPEVGMPILKYKGSDTQPSIKMLEVGRYTLLEETTGDITTVKLGPRSCFYIHVR